MRKIFLTAALASVALVGCVTDESVVDATQKDSEIRFVAANYAAQTRAEHGASTFTNSDYTVWAWQDGEDVAHMNGVRVTYNNTNGTSAVNGTYYWPNYDLDFAATSPDGDDRISLTRSGGTSTITFTFDETNPNETTTNLMYADFVESQSYDIDTGEGTQTVALLFRHVLAKLNVKVQQENPSPIPTGIASYSVVVNSLSFDDMLCEGSLTVKEGVYNGHNQNYLWDPASSPTTTADWAIISSDESLATVFTSANYFVMPQTIPADAKLNITYTVTTTFDNSTTSTKQYTKAVALKTITDGSAAITEWKTNKNITYTINIKPADLGIISFTVQEEEMGTIGGTHTFQ